MFGLPLEWILGVATVANPLILSLITYKIAVRKGSGSINTTEAQTLWAAQEGFREAQRHEIGRLRADYDALAEKLMQCESRNHARALEVDELRFELAMIKNGLKKAGEGI